MFFALSFLSASRQHHDERHRHHYHHRDEIPNVSVRKTVGSQIYDKALSKVGCIYIPGSAGPNAFDSSGLVMWAHAQVGISIPRQAKDQAKAGCCGTGAKGDVIVFGSPAYEVGICRGDGYFVFVQNYHRDKVRLTNIICFRDRHYFYRRFY